MLVVRHGRFCNPFPMTVFCNCGCEYIAEEKDGELFMTEDGSGTLFEVYCPECGACFRRRISIQRED